MEQAIITLTIPVIGIMTGLLIPTFIVNRQGKRARTLSFTAHDAPAFEPVSMKSALVLTLSTMLVIVLGVLCTWEVITFIVENRVVQVPPHGHGGITIDRLPQPRSVKGDDIILDGSAPKTPSASLSSNGKPKPVEDNLASNESILTQEQLNQANSQNTVSVADATAPGAIITDQLIPDKFEYQDLDQLPVLVKAVTPVYPDIAKMAGQQGRATVYLYVGLDGRVIKAEINKSSGSPVLDEAALQAARQFLFTPAIAPGGKPAKVWISYPVDFKLNN